jgi:hypothetical protein
MSADKDCGKLHVWLILTILTFGGIILAMALVLSVRGATIETKNSNLEAAQRKVDSLGAKATDNLGRLASPADGIYVIVGCADRACFMTSGERDKDDSRHLVVRGYQVRYGLSLATLSAGQAVRVEGGQIREIFRKATE